MDGVKITGEHKLNMEIPAPHVQLIPSKKRSSGKYN